MATCGGPTSQAPGDFTDMVESFDMETIDGDSIRSRCLVWGPYRSRYVIPFVDGVYYGRNEFHGPLEQVRRLFAPAPDGTNISCTFLDGGDWESFSNGYSPVMFVEADEANTARRLRLAWTSTFEQTTTRGDSQLAAIVISGAQRFYNCEAIPEQTTRARLSYSITSVGTTRIVRWWAADRLVAEGNRVGNGSVVCSPINGSGLSATAVLTYTADVKPRTAYLYLRWPASYQVHFSTSSLTYPRTPEAIVLDDGTSSYTFLSTVQTAGTYNWNILPVDDDGLAQTSGITAQTAITLNTQPSPPTSIAASGTAAALTLSWAVGESGCTFTVYRSNINMPIEFGAGDGPTPITTAVDATSSGAFAVSGNPDFTREPVYDALVTVFDLTASDIADAFNTGQNNFFVVVDLERQAIATAVKSYQDFALVNAPGHAGAIEAQFRMVIQAAQALDAGMDDTAWRRTMGPHASRLLSFMGAILEANPGRYSLRNAAVHGQDYASGLAQGSGATGVGPSSTVSISLKQLVLTDGQNFTPRSIARFVVRATKSSIQETFDDEFEVEFDSTGAIQAPRPNPAYMQSLTISSGTNVTTTAATLVADSVADATHLDLYVVPLASTINLSSPSASTTFGTDLLGQMFATVSYDPGASGWYRIAVTSRDNSTGQRSREYTERIVYLDSTAPSGVSTISGQAIRGAIAGHKTDDV